MKSIEDKIPGITNVANKIALNAKIMRLKVKYLVLVTKLLKFLLLLLKIKYLALVI